MMDFCFIVESIDVFLFTDKYKIEKCTEFMAYKHYRKTSTNKERFIWWIVLCYSGENLCLQILEFALRATDLLSIEIVQFIKSSLVHLLF